jgi:hypothetical protein
MKTCSFCFMREGNRCYAEPVKREKDGTSKKIVELHQTCDVPSQYKNQGEFYKFLAEILPNPTTLNKWNKIKEHFNKGGILIWNDPNPIEDNDYKISYLEDIPDEEIDDSTPILIQYNKGDSEAQVFLHEIIIDTN